MRPIRHSLIGGKKKPENAYEVASGGTSRARHVKAQIYSSGKAVADSAERTASAQALPERIGAGGEIVPHFPHVREVSEAPINNMGVYPDEADPARWTSVCEEHFGEVSLVLTDSGKVKTLMVRRPAETQTCVIDWINFTIAEDTWFRTAREQLISDEQIINEASRHFEKIFGFGITDKRDRGMNFYRDSWVLGDGMGFVCFGGQRCTMLVTLTGQGCLNALQGWENRLYHFLTKIAVRPSISRVDLAHDDMEGKYLSVEWAEQQWVDSGYSFREGGRPPEIQRVGNWHRPSGKGRTLTIGLRTSSKFTRFYEKGKKEGDKNSAWCRCEVEFKNTNTVIEPDILLDPSKVFVGAYPCFEFFRTVQTPTRLATRARATQITTDDALAITKRQYGKYIRVFRALFGDQETLRLITNEDEHAFPKRLKPYLSFHDSGPRPIHVEQGPVYVLPWIDFIKSRPSCGLNGANGFA